MPKVTIYHNPKCSKSRQTLALLQEQDVDIEVIEYLKNPPSVDTLRGIVNKLGMCSAMDLIRTKEDIFKELDVIAHAGEEDALLNVMNKNPKLIERPIVIVGENAKIGRPPEGVLDLL